MRNKHLKVHKLIGNGTSEHVDNLHGGFLGTLLSLLPVVGPIVGNLISGLLGQKHGEGVYHIDHPTKKDEMIEVTGDAKIPMKDIGEMIMKTAYAHKQFLPFTHGFIQDDTVGEGMRDAHTMLHKCRIEEDVGHGLWGAGDKTSSDSDSEVGHGLWGAGKKKDQQKKKRSTKKKTTHQYPPCPPATKVKTIKVPKVKKIKKLVYA